MSLFKNFDFNKLKSGLSKTRDKIFNKISETVTGKAVIDEITLEEIEEVLITSDIGFDLAMKIVEEVRKKLKGEKDRSGENVLSVVKSVLEDELAHSVSSKEYSPNVDQYKPFVMLIVGVNGAGKTTTIGKLAHNFKKSGWKVVVGAADTFRAAANEQLEIWAERAGVPIISKHHGADPSSVAYETIEEAIKITADVVMIDTAGRLHTKVNLMEELRKIKNVLSKKLPYAPNEIFLVVDGTTGQNAVQQGKEFSKVTELTGLIVTKLDGTAKGGVIFQICRDLNVPVRYIGVGEGIEDLQNFDPHMYVEAVFTK
ncbi:MAG: signal recognition particle-docking protein FtsY [Ignavibacteriales bacterium]|nr:MAG: signal recognition particle-docking protein FtsY [Ignavibacteriaceae bacterium]MBW7872331.1 signal recognition particle-docking protein FtsY [Ignavibacteria bacterium]MCZ2142614.1 signal recognition particle-docking protein FtsY [Ignavibacteriales bacterium]OQY74580.1 MAG: signal recognition particle-docking protein FtsY [Ignavibacteriales bacterium UTCHB3]MBV6445522.1 Signal recognition particle receptor FtsY [Ignavibacteriaceae bacterium]